MKYLWVDMEMSGLYPETCRILELAAIVTDEKWRELGSFDVIVKQPDYVLDAMDDWCTKTHGASGLTAAVRRGTPEREAEKQFLAFLDQHFAPEDKLILCGNSIGQDRKFLDYHWPRVAARLHYRMVDVTAFKIVFNAAFKIEYKKQGAHRALGDIQESIAELKHYLSFCTTGAP